MCAVRPRTNRRIVVLAPQPFYQDRGTPIAVRQLLLALSQLDHEADVHTFPVGRSLPIPGVRYLRVANPLGIRTVPIRFSVRKIWLDAHLFSSLRRMLRRNRYLGVHAVEEAALLAALAFPSSVPVIEPTAIVEHHDRRGFANLLRRSYG